MDMQPQCQSIFEGVQTKKQKPALRSGFFCIYILMIMYSQFPIRLITLLFPSNFDLVSDLVSDLLSV